MKNYLLLAISLTFGCASMQTQKKLEAINLDFTFKSDTISFHEPILVTVDFNLTGKKDLELYSPFDVMKVYIKENEEDVWRLAMYWGQSLSISKRKFEGGYSESNDYQFSTFWNKEGMYTLKVEYIPYYTGIEGPKIIISKPFVVEKYHPLSEKNAIDWIDNQSNSFKGAVKSGIGGSISDMSTKEVIKQLSEFIEKFPDSKFISVFYMMKFHYLRIYYDDNDILEYSNSKEMYDLLVKAEGSTVYPKVKAYSKSMIQIYKSYLDNLKKGH
jgi:hypothetical protein